MDAWLILMSITFSILIVIITTYLMILYIHPDDKGIGNSLAYKLLVVIGLSTCFGLVLLLPLDVSNARNNGGLDITTFWLVMYVLVFVLVVFMLPFAIFLYESDPDCSIAARLCGALIYQSIVTAFSLTLLLVSFIYCRYASLPLQAISKDTTQFQPAYLLTTAATNTTTNITLTISVSFPIYLMSFSAFIGYVLFVVFGGVGLTALPLDLYRKFVDRPVQMTSAQATRKKLALRNLNLELIETARLLKEEQKEAAIAEGFFNKRKQKAIFNNKLKDFKQKVLDNEREVEVFKLELDLQAIDPLVYYLYLMLAIILAILSLFWWLHIIVYTITYSHNFFNNMLIGLENGNAMFISIILISALSFYMLIVTIKGTFKLGVRIPFLFSFHLMQPNETLMNSFMFNIILILMSSVAIVMFITSNFQEFVRFSDISLMFGSQVKNITFFKYFFQNKIFEYSLVIWTPVAMFIQLLMPNKLNKQQQQIKEIRQGARKGANNV